MKDRRSFLAGAFSCGTLFAASRLPVVAGNFMFHAAEVLVS